MRDFDPTAYGICPECMSYPHKDGCPNKKAMPRIVGRCKLCEEEIFAGDLIIDIDGTRYHDKCFIEEYEREAD